MTLVNFEFFRFKGDSRRYLRFQQWLTKMKITTDKVNVSQEEMIKTVCAKEYNPKDDNEANALAILYLVKEGNAHV